MNEHTTTDRTSRAASVQKVITPGGIEAWLVEDYAVPLIAFDFAFKGGNSQDPDGKPGTATMLAGLLDEGAGPLDSDAFHRALDEKAIEIAFSADRDSFSGRMQSLSRNIGRAFELLRLAVTDARIDADPLERVRAQLNAGLRREINDPDSMAGKKWREIAYPGHVYGRPTRGTLETLPNLTREDLVAMRSTILARDSLKIAVVGAIDAVRLAKHIDDVFGALPAKGNLITIPDVTMQGVGTRHVIDLDVPQATIRFGRPGIARHDPDFVPAFVVNHILGGGVFTARLFNEVREKRGLAYSVYSQLQTNDHSNMLIGATSTKNERAAESLTVIQEQIANLGADGPTEDELDKAKKYLTGSYALRFDTSTKIASQLVHLQMEGFDVDYLDQRNSHIQNVTLDEAKRVAARLFGDGQLLVTVVGKPEGLI